ncbi:hypothetical protein BC832DRAFT_349850 [Gaertneriomyces semiglobifer]|nr:hypothetical protein BC832DRAFT_349850 [Gaertneriomyces semiglobifer]
MLEFSALYCSQLYRWKKVKSFSDGVVKYHVDTSRAVLYDEHGTKLDALHVKKRVEEGDELDFDRWFCCVEGTLVTSQDDGNRQSDNAGGKGVDTCGTGKRTIAQVQDSAEFVPGNKRLRTVPVRTVRLRRPIGVVKSGGMVKAAPDEVKKTPPRDLDVRPQHVGIGTGLKPKRVGLGLVPVLKIDKGSAEPNLNLTGGSGRTTSRAREDECLGTVTRSTDELLAMFAASKAAIGASNNGQDACVSDVRLPASLRHAGPTGPRTTRLDEFQKDRGSDNADLCDDLDASGVSCPSSATLRAERSIAPKTSMWDVFVEEDEGDRLPSQVSQLPYNMGDMRPNVTTEGIPKARRTMQKACREDSSPSGSQNIPNSPRQVDKARLWDVCADTNTVFDDFEFDETSFGTPMRNHETSCENQASPPSNGRHKSSSGTEETRVWDVSVDVDCLAEEPLIETESSSIDSLQDPNKQLDGTVQQVSQKRQVSSIETPEVARRKDGISVLQVPRTVKKSKLGKPLLTIDPARMAHATGGIGLESLKFPVPEGEEDFAIDGEANLEVNRDV